MHEREYLDTLCNTGDGVFIVDSNRQIIRWNKAAEKLLKYSEDEVLNHECYQVVSGRVLPDKMFCGQNCKIHSNALKGVPQPNFDLRTQTSEGEPLWLNVSIISPSDAGEPFIAHILRDVTAEKKRELALKQFLANLGHPGPASENIPAEKSMVNPLPAARYPIPDKPSSALSGREIEVLTLLAEGLSTKNLAQRLDISHFTARNHIQNILVKLNLHSKAQAVSYAFKRGIL
jgi:PAS domain S-box-containing protein